MSDHDNAQRIYASGLFAKAGRFRIGEEVFVDEKCARGDPAAQHTKKTGKKVVEEAKAPGFDFD